MLKTMALRSALIAFTCSVSVAAYAMADTSRSINVPAGKLADALESLARECGVDVIYPAAQVRDLKTKGVSGTLETNEAFRKLLEGTPLILKLEGSAVLITLPRTDTAAVTPSPSVSPPQVALATQPASPSSSRSLWQRLRLAASETDEPGAGAESSAGHSEIKTVEEFEPTVKGMPEVLIKGSKTLNSDIQRTKDDIQPYVIYTAEEIQRSMATNLEDFFRSRLTMSAPPTDSFGELTGSFSQSPSSGSNQSQISLRGLGVDETLILVNGRRRPGVSYINSPMFKLSTKGGFGQPDINGIPLESIERIEVLPATASGIYGGGATGGVINIILKTNFTGTEVTADYANTFDDTAGLKRITANGGMTLEGGRSSINFSASYSEQNPMFVRDRAFFQADARARIASSDPRAYESRNLALPVGYTPNIRAIQTCNYLPPDFIQVCTPSSVPTSLRLKPEFGGTDLGSIVTHVPVGYDGDPRQLVANAGTVDLGLANDLANAGRSLVNNPRTNSVSVTLNRDFTGWLSMYANASRSMNHGSTRSAGLSNTGYVIAADAPTNPFDTPIQVSVPFPGYSFLQSNDSEALDSLLGVTFNLPHDWRGQLEGSWGRSRSQSFGGNPFFFYDQGDTDPVTFAFTRTREGLINAVQRGSVDVLVDPNLHPLDLSAYRLDPYPNWRQTPSDSVSYGGLLRLSGPLFQIPGGAVMLSGLLERRDNEAKEVVSTILNENNDGKDTYRFFPKRSVDTDSYYLEATIPVFSARNALPWVSLLDLQASTRRDKSHSRSVRITGISIDGPDDRPESVNYTDSSVVGTGYTFGFRFAPVQDFILRSSYSRGFLPPSIIQLSSLVGSTDVVDSNAPGFVSAIPADPQRGHELIGTSGIPATIVSEGNPGLKPETSDSVSVGLILQPRFAPGLRLSIDYTQIEKKNEIAPVDNLSMLSMSPEEAARVYPGRITRAPPSPADGYAVGPVTFLDFSLINNLDSTVKAVDFQTSYSLDTSAAGRFEIYSVATLAKEASRRVTVEADLVDTVGFHEGPLKWRGNLGADWNLGALSLGWNMQFLDRYRISYRYEPVEMNEYYARRQGSAYVPSQTYHDLSFRYDLGRSRFASVGLLDGVRISGGVQNVLNAHPPVDTRNLELGYSVYGDPRLRRYTLEVAKSF